MGSSTGGEKKGKFIRAIARELGTHRKTVRKYIAAGLDEPLYVGLAMNA